VGAATAGGRTAPKVGFARSSNVSYHAKRLPLGEKVIFRSGRVFRRAATLVALACAAALTACASEATPVHSTGVERAGGRYLSSAEAAQLEGRPVQAVYVPVYSHIYHRDGREFDLTATLSIRNTDFAHPVIVRDVRYYDTAGALVSRFTTAPVLLPAMATLEFMVGEKDRRGGSGANFVVEWLADAPVSPPLLESVMIATSGQQGISFTSRGHDIAGPGAAE